MQETFTDWTLVSLSPLDAAWTATSATAVLVAAAIVLWSYRGARRRWLLMTMRAVAAVLVLGFLVEPAVQLRVVRKIRNRLAIVVDRSRSMTLTTEGGNSRYASLLGVLETDRQRLEKLAEAHIVEWFDLERPLTAAGLDQPPVAERTNLLAGLERAREMGGGRPLAGLVLISDGADNADLEGVGAELPDPVTARLTRLGAPVNTVDAAAAEGFKDVAIVDLVSDEFGFLHNTLAIDVIVSASGFGNLSVPVTLKREGDVVATQVAAIAEGERVRVTFKTKPDEIGEFVYTVSIPQFAGDAIDANNQRSFVLQVIRDKIRVLQVAGRPSWDEKFLRQHLKENPNVDLVSFFILRTPTDDPSVPENELSLIPFPVNKLFTTELASFDVIIFQNFDYRPYNMAQYLRNIRDEVTKRLGFVMIGGELSFGQTYQGTELDEILPVRLGVSGVRDGKVVPTLTAAGRRHPVTDLTRGGGNNVRLWGRLPSFTSANQTSGLVPGATALVVDEAFALPTGESQPLIAVMDAGEGRSMAIATDAMWRWRFSAHRNGGVSERAFHRFWSNALRWLVKDPEHSRVRVIPEKRRFDAGEAVDITLRVLGRDYQPVPFAHIRATLERADGTVIKIEDLTAGEGGVARHRYTDLPRAAYRVVATASASGDELGTGRGVFVVESTSIEIAEGRPRPELLRAIADSTDGAFLPLEPGLWDKLEVVDPEVVEVARRRNIELWDNSWALAIGVLLLAAEWAIRRRRGYL